MSAAPSPISCSLAPRALAQLQDQLDPLDPSDAFIDGIEIIAEDLGLAAPALLERTQVIIHGTTATTNALLTRSGAHTALVTTRGFRDIVELRRGHRDAHFDSRTPSPQALVPQRLGGVARPPRWFSLSASSGRSRRAGKPDARPVRARAA